MEAFLLLLDLVLTHAVLSEMVCNSSERIVGGNVQYPGQLSVGSVLRYLCPEGKRAYPVSWRVCTRSGEWSPLRNIYGEHARSPKCLPYTCVGPTYLANGFFHPRQIRYAVNETIEFECNQGFSLFGSKSRTCLPNGRWSGRTTVCDDGESFCPDPGIPLGGSRRGDRFDEGDVVTYICFTGLVLKGSKSRHCQSTGRWHGTEGTCENRFSYDEPKFVAEKLTLSEEIIGHAKEGTHLYFVLDASGSVGKENFQKMLKFVTTFSQKVRKISGKVTFFVLCFASRVFYHKKFSESAVYMGFFTKLIYQDFPKEMGTNIGGALMQVLEFVNQTVQTAKSKKVPRQIILLITDGRHNAGPDPTQVVEKIKECVSEPDQNLDIFTIGIGDASKEDLEKLTTKNEQQHSYYFTSYDQLEDLTKIIQKPLGDVTGCGFRGRSRRRRNFGRVFGGEKAEEKQWPWQVRVQANMKSGSYLGGGSIISRRWILTAAHNLFGEVMLLNNTEVTVYVGSVTRREENRREVAEVHVHSRYNNTDASRNENFAYDIALLRLKEDLTYSDKIWPVCLPCTKEVSEFLPSPSGDWKYQCKYQDRILTGYSGNEAREITGYISGWGLTAKNRTSFSLQYGRISIKPRDQCLKDDLDESQLCAKGEGVDTCRGDSGGPFTVKWEQRWIQIGIVSSGFSPACHGDNMGYYTNVVRMMEWVRGKVTDLQYD
ncbi:complement factor B-like isoform X2 [Heterodontus francisci]|uniref:complement factor B-like isoform X2 n=1 Tax=Heterodontus francisci TaxID=7792 RepID=UPI00355BB04C